MSAWFDVAGDGPAVVLVHAAIAGAAHLPNLGRPEEFDRIVLGFLAEHGV